MVARRLSLALALGLVISIPSTASGQIVNVYVDPGGSSYPIGTPVAYTVDFCSDQGFTAGPQVDWGGAPAEGVSWSYPSPFCPSAPGSQRAQGTVTVFPGATELYAWAWYIDTYGEGRVYYIGLQPPPPPVVMPDAEPVSVSPVTAAQHKFAIHNSATLEETGTYDQTYNLATSCTGVASGCSVSPASLVVPNGDTAYAMVTYSASGALGATGVVTLTATGQGGPDNGTLNLTIAPSGPVVDRGLCLTIAAGAGAAYECGDLRLTHALPGVRSLNKDRAPVLIYNTQHARPYPLLQADVTAPTPLPDSIRTVARIGGVIMAQRTWPASAWSAAGQIRRVVVGFLADTLGTGLYNYQLEVLRIRNGIGIDTLQIQSGQLPIVNRKASEFGSGWWIAGWERLYFGGLPSGQAMWVGGDGSVRRYERTGTIGTDTAYLATPVDRPDTLLHKSNGEWVRLLAGGSKVTFTSGGVHRFTTSRTGHSTEFVDSSAVPGLLVRIKVPPSDSGLTYAFTYSGAPRKLVWVGVPDSAGADRLTNLTWVGDTLRITNPSSLPIKFRYEGGATNRIIERHSERGAKTVFEFDAGSRLARSRLAVPSADSINRSFCAAEVRSLASCSPNPVLPDSAYTRFDGPRLPADSADIADFWVGRFGAPTKTRDPYGNVSSYARTDPRWPALVTRAQSPNGRIVGATYDRRGNLATSADSSVQHTMNSKATTRYVWDQKWDAVTQATLPMGEVMRFSYDANNGNRLWQEDGRGTPSRVTFEYYALPPSGNGLVKVIVAPGGARDSVGYDARGNVSQTRTPTGDTTFYRADRIGRVTLVRSKVATVYRHDSTFYDSRSLVTRAVAYGPALNSQAARRLIVQNFYSPDGVLDSVRRSTSPDDASVGTIRTGWRYDLVGRAVVEVAPDDRSSSGEPRIDSTRYDAASNVVQQITRRAHSIAMVYDRANRLRRRIVPQTNYSYRSEGIAAMGNLLNHYMGPYPWYTNDGNGNPMTLNDGDDGLTIAADTATFGYDAMGNMVTADNADARIKRSYFPDGKLMTDTLRIRTYAGSDFSQHAYGIQYAYDAGRRLTGVYHPYQLRGPTCCGGAQYSYDSVGFLRSMVDLTGKNFQFDYNMRGEQVRYTMPGWVNDTMVYDLAGRLVSSKIRDWASGPHAHPDSLYRKATFQYVDPVRLASMVNLAGLRDTITSLYDGLGQLYQMHYRLPAYSNLGNDAQLHSTERFFTDAFGNAYATKDSTNLVRGTGFNYTVSNATSVFAPPSGNPPAGRLREKVDCCRGDLFKYDSAGNTVFSSTFQYAFQLPAILEDRASYYSADNQLRVAEYRRVMTNPQLDQQAWVWFQRFEEYRYDALGRRVLTRTRRNCYFINSNEVCEFGTMRRTVWEGSRELYEIQMPGGDSVSAVTLENDTASVYPRICTNCIEYVDYNLQYGRVAYAYAGGVDQPLSITRINHEEHPYGSTYLKWAPITIAPHWNYRGQPEYGTFGDGGYRHCTTPQATRCVKIAWAVKAFAFTSGTWPAGVGDLEIGWFGTLRELKEDGSGLRYMRNRYLDPATGRFTQEDPIGLAGGSNLYGFANGDPINFADPFGLMACKWHDVECWEDKMWSASGGTGFAGRVLAPLGSTALELSGLSSVDRASKDAAGGSTAGGIALAAEFVFAAVPGGRQGITIGRKAIGHIIGRHGALSVARNSSKFARGVNIERLVQAAEDVAPTVGRNGNLVRVVDAGAEVGVDRATGKATSVYTVVTDSKGNLITAHPGSP